MSTDGQVSREERAARNQSMFRAVNEEMRGLSESFVSITDEYAIVCECADLSCAESLQIRPLDYFAIRGNPRQFAVLVGHVYPDVERVVSTSNGYVVVEKTGEAAVVAAALEPTKD